MDCVGKCGTVKMKIARLEIPHAIHVTKLDIGVECVGAGRQ